eukprot:3431081-Ditylum_brightwellii.AAC.1
MNTSGAKNAQWDMFPVKSSISAATTELEKPPIKHFGEIRIHKSTTDQQWNDTFKPASSAADPPAKSQNLISRRQSLSALENKHFGEIRIHKSSMDQQWNETFKPASSAVVDPPNPQKGGSSSLRRLSRRQTIDQSS